MEADLHAVAMVTLVVFSLALIRWKGRRPTKASAIRGVVAGFAVAAILMGAFVHLCHEGEAWRQGLLAGALAGVAVASARSRAQATGSGLSLVAFGFGLVLHFNHLVHTDSYVGVSNPGPGRLALPVWHTPFTGIYQERRQVDARAPKPVG